VRVRVRVRVSVRLLYDSFDYFRWQCMFMCDVYCVHLLSFNYYYLLICVTDVCLSSVIRPVQSSLDIEGEGEGPTFPPFF
jgi:hypothetical protein